MMEYLQCGISHDFTGLVPLIVAIVLLEMKIDISESKYAIPAIVLSIFQYIAYIVILINSKNIAVGIFGDPKYEFFVYLFVIAGAYTSNFSKTQVKEFTKKLRQYEDKEDPKEQ